METLRNTVLILFLALIITGVGGYITMYEQAEELEELEEERELARLQQAEVEELLAEKAQSQEAADEIIRKWNARYKYVPREIATPDILEYLESLTRRGFDSFNMRLNGVNTSGNINAYTFDVQGTGYYSNLYDLIWHLENNREFYRVRDLSLRHQEVTVRNASTGRETQQQMVGFSMQLDAYFGGPEGLSTDRSALVAISRDLLPEHEPAHNSFYPVLRESLPPNTDNLLEIEDANLLAIAGDRAIFEDQHGRHAVSVGDRVYLGLITEIDHSNLVVRARLNKGGIIREVTAEVESVDPFRDRRRQ